MEEPSMSAARPKTPRLLIADDDAVIRSVLEMSLSSDFEIVGVAADADEAIELAHTMQPDAALVDVEMPKGGGLRAVPEILKVAPQTAIVVLSIDESDGLVRELINAGAIAYCRKGIAPESLAESLIDAIAVRARELKRLPASLAQVV
jgi:DNA-binding NarL/FixJ family response regulator